MRNEIRVLTDAEANRLRAMLRTNRMASGEHDRRRIKGKLEQILDQAVEVASPEIPADVVTLNSQIVIRDLQTGDKRIFVVRLPVQTSASDDSISVVTAALGRRIGDHIECEDANHSRRWSLERMLHQPESAGE